MAPTPPSTTCSMGKGGTQHVVFWVKTATIARTSPRNLNLQLEGEANSHAYVRICARIVMDGRDVGERWRVGTERSGTGGESTPSQEGCGRMMGGRRDAPRCGQASISSYVRATVRPSVHFAVFRCGQASISSYLFADHDVLNAAVKRLQRFERLDPFGRASSFKSSYSLRCPLQTPTK